MTRGACVSLPARTVSRFRLRHQSTDLELRIGEFVIGRSSTCNLVLDDALVSRQHARIVVAEQGATIEDLGSRNGIRVNGAKVEGVKSLRHLDRIGVGNQDMLLLDADADRGPGRGTGERCTKCGAVVGPSDNACAECGTPLYHRRPTLDQMTVEFRLPVESPEGPRSSKPPASSALVASIAHKALALGRLDEAERILAPYLDQMLLGLGEPTAPGAAQVREATDFALRLAEGPGGARWVGWIVAAHTAARRLPDAPTVDKLYELVRKTRYADARALQRYLDVLANQSSRLSAADRFLVKRLEGLLRLVSA